jgi:hypothetical protein
VLRFSAEVDSSHVDRFERPVSLHFVGSAFAIENMACFSTAFCFAWSWFFAAHDEAARFIASDDLL